jgi:death-on-curing protein
MCTVTATAIFTKSPPLMPFNIAESQAYFDGNKRTGVQAATDFLEINSIDTNPLPEMATYEALIRVANHELDRLGLAAFFRYTLQPK